MSVVQDVRVRGGVAPAAESSQASWTSWYIRCALGLDFLVALSSCVLALLVRFPRLVLPYTIPYVALTIALPFAWVIAVALARAYEPRFMGVGSDEFRRVLNAGVSLLAVLAVLAYATKTEVARGYVVLALPLTIGLGLGGRYFLRKRLHRRRARGECMRRVMAVGHAGAVADVVRQFRRERYHGMDVVGTCLPVTEPDDAGDEQVDGVPVLGDFSEVALAVNQCGADTVAVLACPEMDGVALRRLAWQLERDGTDLVVAPGLMEVAGPRTTIRPVAGLPLLHVEHPELAGMRHLVKNLFDRLLAGAALVLLGPLFAMIAAAIRLSSSGPMLFRQVRVGKDGQEFTLVKFRTMCADAERRRTELAELNEHDGVLFKIRHDPRVTRVGAWLRRYSLDELPQLINVVLGHMSLVGPRPPLPEEVARYGDDVRRRLVVKPGMTGLWQISGRADLTWEESVRIDLRYVENWSLTLDLVILWKTWYAVTHGSGAY